MEFSMYCKIVPRKAKCLVVWTRTEGTWNKRWVRLARRALTWRMEDIFSRYRR